jgi:uncharacterized protein (TIGR02757 family)
MGKKVSNQRREEIRVLLHCLCRDYDRKFIPEDPVSLVHTYQDPRDQEIVGLIASLLAFGNAKAIRGSVAKILKLMGERPSQFIAAWTPDRHVKGFESLGHRWVRGADLLLLIDLLKGFLDRHGSLKETFLVHYREDDADIGPILTRFSREVRRRVGQKGAGRGFRYFFPSPQDGSPCKRLNMFLRWMVRPADGIDLGLWPEISPSKLVIPMDTHVYRFARRFRLGSVRSPTWRLAREVTDFLKELDPKDPVKYDFPICHFGMREGW